MAQLFSLWIFLFGLQPLAVSSEIPFYTKKDFTPIWDQAKIQSDKIIALPDFKLTDQNGKIFGQQQMRGQISVVNFLYATCPGICPAAMSQLGRAKEKLASLKGIRLVSFSITPAVDTPKIMLEFAKRRKLNLENWFLLSGNESEVKKVSLLFQANKDVLSRKTGEFVHSENVFLLDKKGRLRGIYNVGSQADMELLVKDSLAL